MSTEERRPPAWWLPEITLVGLTVALALSFARLFSGWDWLIPVLALPAIQRERTFHHSRHFTL